MMSDEWRERIGEIEVELMSLRSQLAVAIESNARLMAGVRESTRRQEERTKGFGAAVSDLIEINNRLSEQVNDLASKADSMQNQLHGLSAWISDIGPSKKGNR